jgi:hypothetical protein
MAATTLWTLDELSAAVARALAVDYDGQPSARVRDVPDRRTIRYYTTLGLIDRPAALRGRTALYGRRHLLQLTAIKRLQAAGLSLAEVQLAGPAAPPPALLGLPLADGVTLLLAAARPPDDDDLMELRQAAGPLLDLLRRRRLLSGDPDPSQPHEDVS